MSTQAPGRLDAADLLALPDRKNYELVDGQLVELKMSQESSWVAGEVYSHLRDFVKSGNLGWVYPEGPGFQCFADDRDKVRKPDVSFVSLLRQPHGPARTGFGRVAPDLAVEVVSPHDLYLDVQFKVEDWMEAGTSVVWVVMPPQRTVTVYRPERDPHVLGGEQEITLDELLPGFRCGVSEFFPAA